MSQYNFYNQPKKVTFLDIIWYYKYHVAFYMVCISFFTFIALYSLNIVPDELKMAGSIPDTALANEPATSSIPFISPLKS